MQPIYVQHQRAERLIAIARIAFSYQLLVLKVMRDFDLALVVVVDARGEAERAWAIFLGISNSLTPVPCPSYQQVRALSRGCALTATHFPLDGMRDPMQARSEQRVGTVVAIGFPSLTPCS